MESLMLTSNDVDVLASTFFLWSAVGLFFGLLIYDLVCWLFFGAVRRFSSRTKDIPVAPTISVIREDDRKLVDYYCFECNKQLCRYEADCLYGLCRKCNDKFKRFDA